MPEAQTSEANDNLQPGEIHCLPDLTSDCLRPKFTVNYPPVCSIGASTLDSCLHFIMPAHAAVAKERAVNLQAPPKWGAEQSVAIPGTTTQGRSATYRHWRFQNALLESLDPSVRQPFGIWGGEVDVR